jgi:hypothetical protein
MHCNSFEPDTLLGRVNKIKPEAKNNTARKRSEGWSLSPKPIETSEAFYLVMGGQRAPVQVATRPSMVRLLAWLFVGPFPARRETKEGVREVARKGGQGTLHKASCTPIAHVRAPVLIKKS